MTRVNQPDTILTELREIRRRLHALETAARAGTVNRAAPLSEPDTTSDDDPDAG